MLMKYLIALIVCTELVSEFSKKTGDYPVLSAVDMRIIALTYELHKTYVGVNDLRSVPLPEV